MSLRLRLTLWYSSVLFVVLGVFGVAVYNLLSYVLIAQVDAALSKAAARILERSAIRVTGINPALLYLPVLDNELDATNVLAQAWRTDFTLITASSNLRIYGEPLDKATLHRAVTEPEFSSTRFGNMPVRVLTMPIRDREIVYGYLQTAASIQVVEEAQKMMALVLGVGGLVAVLLAAAIGWFSASRALKPLAVITRTAMQINRADDLSRRIPVNPNRNDEVTRLSVAFNESLERLERLFNTQRRFLADVSHELRTPLTTVRGNVDLIRRLGAADPESLDAIASETDRMARLVDNLLLLAQSDSGNLPLVRSEVDLDTLLLEVYKEARILAGDRLTVTLGEIDQVRLVGDRDRLKQIMLNLTTNALKFTPDGGRVTLSLARINHWARLTVSDTGIGIPPAELKKVFERFYRVDKARSRALGGSGLGLSIAQRLATMHGGRIEVTSEGIPGKGTTFSVWLPMPVEPQPATADTPRRGFPRWRLPDLAPPKKSPG